MGEIYTHLPVATGPGQPIQYRPLSEIKEVKGIDYKDINTRHAELRILDKLTDGTNPTLTNFTDLEVIGFGALEAVDAILRKPIYDLEGEWGPKYDPASNPDPYTGLRPGVIVPHGLRASMGIIANISKRRPSVNGIGRKELISGIGKIQINYGLMNGGPTLYPTEQANKPGLIQRAIGFFRGNGSGGNGQ